MAFYPRSSLVVRWDIPRRWQGREARNFYPRTGWVRQGLSLDGEGGVTSVRGGWMSEPTDPGIFLWTPSSFFPSSSLSLSSLPLSMVTFRLPDLLLVFSGAAPITSSQFPAVGGRTPVARGRVSGDQRLPTSRVCGGQVEGWEPYNILEGAMIWSEPSMSVGPPPPKRHRLVPTAMVSHLKAQEIEAAALDPSVHELKGASE